MDNITFKTTNESKTFEKPKIPAGEYIFTVSDIKLNNEKSKFFFICDIEDQKTESGEQLSLVWSAPLNDEYTDGTNVGKMLLALGLDLGNEVDGKTLIGLKGKALVNDYAKQENGKTQVFSVIGELVLLEKKEETEETTENQTA
jgi:hypothetical protein